MFQNRCHHESRTQVQQRFDDEDFEELTRCEMCMAIAIFYSQEEVHHISGSSTKKRSIEVEAYSQIHVHF